MSKTHFYHRFSSITDSERSNTEFGWVRVQHEIRQWSTSLKKSQIPCGFSDLWVDLVSPAGPLGRLGQRPTVPTVGGT